MAEEDTAVNALEAAEAAVRHLKAAQDGARSGTGQAWQVQGDWNEAIRCLRLALDQCLSEKQPRYAIERDESGKAIRMWWVPPTREES